MTTEIDGVSRNENSKTLAYTIKNIYPRDEHTLLEVMLYMKFREKAMMNARKIITYEQFKKELENKYLRKRSTAHLQLKFNLLRHKNI